ncbi:hypothetical protein O972_18205 [Mycobacterium avium subsp. avium 10-9275]|nr:hypothetical protein O972_18205 [Mycobacterium avium subsp. avium 10-9275]
MGELVLGDIRRHRRLPGELRRNLDQCFIDQYRNGIQIGRVGFESEALSFERDSTAAGERVEDRWGIAVGGFKYLGVRLGEQLPILDVFPHDEALDELVQPLAFLAL